MRILPDIPLQPNAICYFSSKYRVNYFSHYENIFKTNLENCEKSNYGSSMISFAPMIFGVNFFNCLNRPKHFCRKKNFNPRILFSRIKTFFLPRTLPFAFPPFVVHQLESRIKIFRTKSPPASVDFEKNITKRFIEDIGSMQI